MLDKIRGKKKDEDKDTPDLRGNNKKKDDSDIGGRLKGMVGRVTGKKGEEKKEEKPAPTERKMPRPMPKPMAKPGEKPKLRSPQAKPERKGPGMGGFGRRIPDEDQRTLVGAAVVGIIIIVVSLAAFYFLWYAPYQENLNNAKQAQLNLVNTYFTGPLATDPIGINLRAQIESATTTSEIQAIDVLTPATQEWRIYQTGQIQNVSAQPNSFGRVMVVYAAGTQKDVILKVADAQNFVNQNDASVLSNVQIKFPDTVAIPIIVSRLQAAGGLINVGNSVDVYLMNGTSNVTGNNTPNISGATVLAILRAKDSGTIAANKKTAQELAINNLVQSNSRTTSASEDVEQLLRAAAANNWDQNEVSSLLNAYGWRLSDFERSSNLGELDAQYLVLLEVPRDNALFLIQNMNNVILTIPTQQAPVWMSNELKTIYG